MSVNVAPMKDAADLIYSQFGRPRKTFGDERIIVWFSCGAASAFLAKIMVPYGAEVVHCDATRDEHPDNLRFYNDVQDWIGQEIKSVRNMNYPGGIDEVFANTKYMAGIAGARCTVELKKGPRIDYQQPTDIHCFGYTSDEVKRAKRMEDNNPELRLMWPLIDKGVTKEDCLLMLKRAGIELPTMYKLGFKNNNCLGCVKATSPKYWNQIRRHFPAAFKERAERSRELGVRLTRYKGERIFLDELPPDSQEDFFEDLSCGPQCIPNP